MDDKEFEELINMAKSNDPNSKDLAVILANNSDLPFQDKHKIYQRSQVFEWDVEKSLNPFKK